MKVESDDDEETHPLVSDVEVQQSDSKPHVCRCGKAFPLPIQLMEHIKSVHLQLEDFVCQECGDTFSTQNTLNVHIGSDHANLEYDENTASLKPELKLEENSSDTEEELDSPKAMKPLDVKLELEDECSERDCTEEKLDSPKALKPLDVKLELEDQSSERDVTKEKIDSHKDPLISCEECGVVFSRSSSLLKHSRNIHGKELSRGQKYWSRKPILLPRGYDEYKDSEPNKCKCGKTFGRSEHLKQHIKSVHLKLRDCICDQCGDAFTTTFALKGHIKKVHDKIKDLKCSKCDMRFSDRSVLKKHEARDHTKLQRKYENKIIKAKFDEYMATEPNTCKCGMTLTRSDSFQKHVKNVHLKIFDHKCVECGSNFSDSYGLKDHINTVHPNSVHQKKYKCSKCDPTFAKRYRLKKHEEETHNIKSLVNDALIEGKNVLCETCGMSFSNKCNLNRHMKTAHPTIAAKHVSNVHLKIRQNSSRKGVKEAEVQA